MKGQTTASDLSLGFSYNSQLTLMLLSAVFFQNLKISLGTCDFSIPVIPATTCPRKGHHFTGMENTTGIPINLTRVACISAGHLSFNAELSHMEGGPSTRASGTHPWGCESLEVLVPGGGALGQ